jgi:pilus assembly protein CpaE
MDRTFSLLVIGPDADLIRGIDLAGQSAGGLDVSVNESTLAELNGQAFHLGKDKDVIAVWTNLADPAEMAALAALASARGPQAPTVALADGNVSILQAKMMTDAGITDVLPLPASADELFADLAKLAKGKSRARMHLAGVEERRAKVIVVVPARGGIGATTLSVNLAERLGAPRGRGRKKPGPRVALIDLDLQFGSVGSMLDLPEQDTMAQLAVSGVVPDETLLEQSMQTHSSGLHALCAPTTLVPPDALRSEQVAALIESLGARYDYIVVDLPHTLVSGVEPVIARADLALLVTDTSVPAIRQSRRIIDFLTADHLSLPVRIVVSRDRKPLFGSNALREATRAMGRGFWHWLPADPRSARSAADQGRPLCMIGGKLGRSIDRMAKGLVQEFALPTMHEERV